MADNVTTEFPKMGDEGIPHSVVNMSGQRSPYTLTAPKKTMGRGTDPSIGTMKSRGRTLIKEAQGPTLKPIQTICYPNAPDGASGGGQRQTYTIKSALGDRDFFKSRAAYRQGV
jgi:hypothetical protein